MSDGERLSTRCEISLLIVGEPQESILLMQILKFCIYKSELFFFEEIGHTLSICSCLSSKDLSLFDGKAVNIGLTQTNFQINHKEKTHK